MRLPRLIRKRARLSAEILDRQGGVMPETGPAADRTLHVESRTVQAARQMRGRVLLSALVLGGLYLGLGARLWQISFAPLDLPPMLVETGTEEAPGERAVIRDRNGRYLAMNREVTGLQLERAQVSDPEVTAIALARVLPGVDAADLARKLRERRYVTVDQELTPEEHQAVLALGLPGVRFVAGTKRVYPQGALAAHVTGYVQPGRGGVSGLEHALDRLDPGASLVSSLDIAAQQIVEQELAAAVSRYEAKAGWAVLMDVTTGEVVALASLPDFNPNQPGTAEAAHRRNRVLHDVYEQGSAFKIFTAAMALEEGAVGAGERFDVRHPLVVRDRLIRDFHPRGGYMTLGEILQYSSNIGAARIALALGRERQQYWLAELGLLSRTESEVPEARNPVTPSLWGDVEIATISYGHGIAVTPMQMTAAFAAVVNGGTWHAPTFLKAELSNPGHRVFRHETSAAMRVMLRHVVTDGTGRNAEADGYYVIGKTATADKPEAGGYAEDRRLSSFIGAFPGYDPKYALLVSLDEPLPDDQSHGYATAGIVAAPAFRNMVLRLGPVLGLYPVSDDLAFAGFMGDLREGEAMRLAMAGEALGRPASSMQDDALGAFLEELGP